MAKTNWTQEYINSFFAIEKSQEEFLDEEHGDYKPYYRINNNPSVICYALTPEDKVLMVEQFRPNLGQVTLELPAGGIFVDLENPMQAAMRELKEETGWSSSLKQIGNGYWTRINRDKFQDYGFAGVAIKENLKNKLEENTIVKEISRCEFSSLIQDGLFPQLSALGLIYAASKKFGRDLLEIGYIDLEDLIAHS